MIDFILSRFDTILYFVVFIGIYVFIIYLWRKIAALETSVYRLDKALTNIICEKEKQKFDNSKCDISFQNVFSSQKNDDIVILSDDKIEEIHNVNDNDVDEVVKELLEENTSYTKTQLHKMTVENVKEIALKHNLSVEGNKNDIISRILDMN